MARGAAKARGGDAVVVSREAQRFVRATRMPAVFQIVLKRTLAAKMRKYRDVNWSEVCRIGFRRAVGMAVPERLGDVPWRKSRGVGFAGVGSIGVALDEELAARMALVHGMDWRGYVEFVLEKFIEALEQGVAEGAGAKSDAERRALEEGAARDLERAARRVNRGVPKARKKRAAPAKRTAAGPRARGRRRGRPRVRGRPTRGLADPEPDGEPARGAEGRS